MGGSAFEMKASIRCSLLSVEYASQVPGRRNIPLLESRQEDKEILLLVNEVVAKFRLSVISGFQISNLDEESFAFRLVPLRYRHE